MAHGLSELGPSFLRERIVLPIESLIAELDAARHETAFLELLESRVNRPGLGTPVAGEPLLQFPDHLVPVHRLLRQEQEQPKRDGSNLHADRKSTRLNSSHRCISYAVFCLKKKKNTKHT